jgi:hypothetical protein
MQNGDCPGGRCDTPHTHYGATPLPPSFLSRETGAAGCRAIAARHNTGWHASLIPYAGWQEIEGSFPC